MMLRPRRCWAAIPLLLTFASCGGDEPAGEELIRPVRYQRVYATGGGRVRTFSGTAQAGRESQLSFKVPGTIGRMAVSVGDVVQKGALIAQLDPSDYELRVQEIEASLAQAQAQRRNAESSYQRAQALYENANASKQDLDAARASFESTAAQVASIAKQLELARLQVTYTRLTAPFEGAIAEVRADANENVAAGTPIAIISSEDQPEVQVAVPEVLIARIQVGDTATVSFDALPGRQLSATVSEVGVSSTGFATTFPVTVRLNEAMAEIRPGMAAEVAFRLDSAGVPERMIVPSVAVGEDRLGRYVFVVEPLNQELGIARRRDVRTGELTSEGMEILGGVQEDDLVITAGLSRISDGQKVRLQGVSP